MFQGSSWAPHRLHGVAYTAVLIHQDVVTQNIRTGNITNPFQEGESLLMGDCTWVSTVQALRYLLPVQGLAHALASYPLLMSSFHAIPRWPFYILMRQTGQILWYLTSQSCYYREVQTSASIVGLELRMNCIPLQRPAFFRGTSFPGNHFNNILLT